MLETSFPSGRVKLLSNLCKNKSIYKNNGNNHRMVHIKRGVRQGCTLFPSLFNVTAEIMMRVTLEALLDDAK